MEMEGVKGFGGVEACVMGIKAGLNMFIYRFSDEKTINIIESVYKLAQKDEELATDIENSYNKIMDLKRKYLF